MRSSLLSVKQDLQAFLVLASVLISVLRKSFVCMRRIRFWHTFLVRCTDTPLHDCPHWDRDSQWMWFSGPEKYDLWPRCPLDVVTLLTRHTFQPAQCGMLYFWARGNLPLFVCVCSYILCQLCEWRKRKTGCMIYVSLILLNWYFLAQVFHMAGSAMSSKAVLAVDKLHCRDAR